ncbi:MAG: nucleotidyltransferase family protein [Oscillospiraceae bacterium]|nr:nucleotidyltransferase family protein [Oscillospiraceae bacterium]
METEMLLVALLRVAVCDWAGDDAVRAACTPEALEKVCALATKYDLAHLLGIALNKLGFGNTPVAQIAGRQQMMATFRYVQLSHEQESIIAVLEEGQIPFLPLKGAVLRGLYPEGWMRTSCDIDVLVHEEDLDRAAELLQTKLQYTLRGKTAHDLALNAPSGVHLELHYSVLEKSELSMLPKVLESIWEAAVPAEGKQYNMMLDDAMFYCYHIAHMAKHFEIGGCGIRPLLDIWVLRHRVFYKEDARKDLLQKGGLLAFAEAAENLSEHWFSGKNADPISRQLAQYILSGGNYGGVENRIAVKHTQNQKGFAYVLSRLFLPYDTMKIQFPILEKQKWLLPFCHVARWFKRLFDGGSARAAKELQTNANMTEEKVLSTEELLRHLGLHT